MPTLNKPQKREVPRNEHTQSREMRRKAYNNTDWRKLRDNYIKQHPLCEDCLDKGKVTAAEDVHHLKSPFASGDINYGLLLDGNNLRALCKECHAARHNHTKNKPTIQDVLRQLADLLDENKSDKELEDDN